MEIGAYVRLSELRGFLLKERRTRKELHNGALVRVLSAERRACSFRRMIAKPGVCHLLWPIDRWRFLIQTEHRTIYSFCSNLSALRDGGAQPGAHWRGLEFLEIA